MFLIENVFLTNELPLHTLRTNKFINYKFNGFFVTRFCVMNELLLKNIDLLKKMVGTYWDFPIQ